eukprot:11180638-Lingulodinium_polyedra.AAC.1
MNPARLPTKSKRPTRAALPTTLRAGRPCRRPKRARRRRSRKPTSPWRHIVRQSSPARGALLNARKLSFCHKSADGLAVLPFETGT